MDEIKTLLKIKAKNSMSIERLNSLRARKRKMDRAKVKNKNADTRKFTVHELLDDLKKSYLDPDRDVFIHGSFSKINAGIKAEELIKIFQDFMSPSANILMPAYPMPGTMQEWMSDPAPFDVQNSPSMMGILTEVFRRHPGVRRSLHPSHSVCAFGPDADYYVRDHHTSPLPCGSVSPFARLVERGGQILCIGSDVGKVTAYHVVEDTTTDFPVNVYTDAPMSKKVINNGTEIEVVTQVANPALSPWRVDNYPLKLEEFKRHMKAFGCLRSSQFGSANFDVIDAERFLDMLKNLAKKGITIYHRPENPIIRKIAGFPF